MKSLTQLSELVKLSLGGMQCTLVSINDLAVKLGAEHAERILNIDLTASVSTALWATEKTQEELIAEIEADILALRNCKRPEEVITLGDFVDRPAMSVGYDLETGELLHSAPVQAWPKYCVEGDDRTDMWVAFSELLKGRKPHELVIVGTSGTSRSRSLLNAARFIDLDYSLIETPEIKLSHEPLWKQQQHASWKTKH